MGGLGLSGPHLPGAGTFSSLITEPRQLHPGGPGEGWWAGAGLSVRLSVSTHHRAQSLFPRLKPSQLKSSKPRVVGATPPPAEERDRCSREGGRGGGPAKPVGDPCPTLDMHLQPAPPSTAQGPWTAGTRPGENRRGTRQAEAAPSVSPDGSQLAAFSSHPCKSCCTGGAGMPIRRGSATVPEPAIEPATESSLEVTTESCPPSLLPDTSCSHITCVILPHPWATCTLVYLVFFKLTHFLP